MSGRDVHLLVLVHGMWGNPKHLAEMDRIIKETKGRVKSSTEEPNGDVELDVLVAQKNRDESTYDGIDWGGERVADEVIERTKEIESSGRKVVRFSITGYSLGGLLSRYVIGILHRRSFFSAVKPINFTTFATPHIGLVRMPSFLSTVQWTFGPKLLSRTGEQFYAADKWGVSGRSLLEVMADPKEIFYQALSSFEHIRIYGNAVNDLTVPYITALIETEDPFINRAKTGIEVELDPTYDPIMVSYSIPDEPPKTKSPTLFSFSWFREAKPMSYLPPPLQSLKFPLNVVAFVLLPVLIPTFISLILLRLSLHARSSRARIKLLEGDASMRENALVTAFSQFERELEEAVVGAMEDDQGADMHSVEAPTEKTRTINQSMPGPRARARATSSSDKLLGKDLKGKKNFAPGQPLLMPTQISMAGSLNALPRMTKHLVYLDPLRNSHATIIARDVKGYAFHQRGWGVLQHWADAFVL